VYRITHRGETEDLLLFPKLLFLPPLLIRGQCNFQSCGSFADTALLATAAAAAAVAAAAAAGRRGKGKSRSGSLVPSMIAVLM